MNAWGLIIIAIGVGVLWWAKEQTGSLDDILSDITGNVVKSVVTAPAKIPAAVGKQLIPDRGRGNFDGIPGTAWINDL